MKIAKLTDDGNIGVATISSDGRYIAYSLKAGQQSSLWVRQVAVENSLNLAPKSDGHYGGLAFSPDNDFLYFLHNRKGTDHDDVYVVPVLGGATKVILQDVNTSPAVSPDGKKLAFVRGLIPSRSQLLAANSDGTDEHVVADPVKTKLGKFWSYDSPSWSRDGKLLASTLLSQNGEAGIFISPVDGGAPTIVP